MKQIAVFVMSELMIKLFEKEIKHRGLRVVVQPLPEAKEEMTQRLMDEKIGMREVNYKLRDWGVSRQRYWGCPIPMIHCPTCGVVPVPDNALVQERQDVIWAGGGDVAQQQTAAGSEHKREDKSGPGEHMCSSYILY